MELVRLNEKTNGVRVVRKICILFAISILFSGCASTIKVNHSTTSGKPEVVIDRPYSRQMIDAFKDMMAAEGFTTVSDTNNILIFENELQKLWTKASLFSHGLYKAHIEFKMIEMDDAVLVIASCQYIDYQSGNYTSYRDQNDHADSKTLQIRMNSIKAELESMPINILTPVVNIDLTSTTVTSVEAIQNYSTSQNQFHSYKANGKREIILIHLASDNFNTYFVTYPGSNEIMDNWGKYSMLRGYLSQEKPIKIDNYNYYAFVLQTGKTVYYREYSHEPLGSNFKHADIMWYSDYMEDVAYVGQPLIKGSSVKFVSYDRRWNNYFTNTGETLKKHDIDNIRKLVENMSKNKIQVAEYLLDYSVSYKEFDKKYFISNRHSNEDQTWCSVSVYLGIRNKEVWGRFELTYHAYDWLFVNRFSVVADEYVYNSPSLNFDRDSTDRVWETFDGDLSNTLYTVAEKISQSNKTIIRFYGNEGTSDFTVSSTQKNNIASTIKLYSLIKNSI
ncbi:hypothetical protein GKC30_11685 [Pseudodesulfovibrio sp. F-1]|uniref:Lipoprotein n=1 Tax=Pseudodesulfovibrio alkaliphilus TaxID=2661613 RepID=A0A7K1KQC2_9BACT|nr:hypothetical protein [Pseudodesulfovibrio alkaliphilus]MUM78296.1 hypothetical protein [Pseudodesulfovibrio alkaliphilus]